MNAPLLNRPHVVGPVPAAELAAQRFTVAQIWALINKGVMLEDAKFELLDGEVIPISPKGALHEDVRCAVMDWVRALPPALTVMVETTLYMDDESFLEPDYVVFDQSVAIKDLKPADIRVAIEVGDSSWDYDTRTKAGRYAADGVQEYWAIHAPTRMIRVHRNPSAAGWTDVTEFAAGAPVSPLCAATFPLTLLQP
jgi:Uma2 family endonuclease